MLIDLIIRSLASKIRITVADYLCSFCRHVNGRRLIASKETAIRLYDTSYPISQRKTKSNGEKERSESNRAK